MLEMYHISLNPFLSVKLNVLPEMGNETTRSTTYYRKLVPISYTVEVWTNLDRV